MKGQRAWRVRKRLEVRYGPERPEHTGYSGNISSSGMMIRTTRVFGQGVILRIELITPEATIPIRGRVMWAREGSLTLISTGRIGMGVRFIDELPQALLAMLEQATAG